MRIGIAIGAVVVGLAVAFLVVVVVAQRRFIYPAPRATGEISAPGFSRVVLHTADGLDLGALYRPRPRRRTIVFFHGNGDSLRGSLVATQVIAAAGYGVLLPEYRGYGGNPGSPSESGLYADARAATAFLRRRGVASGDIVAIGNSLGSGPATEVATGEKLGGLMIVSGFTSLPALAADATGLPIAPLIWDKYDNAAKLTGSTIPIVVLHADNDQVIPISHGQRLALASKTFLLVFAGVGHGLAYVPAAGTAEVRWLDGLDSKMSSRTKPVPAGGD
ncbi:alpha/beta hydrolase [Glacieibacterium megasporae]|uniref:alpha/beta hydrolase n=1 Tax=Glacieibacterium megasporae TaxID=2835787 RepID=UPI001C1E5B25|nr:alpha/beta hydrolase [Polymorphobacter megasporae]UAJ08830.1 alpha/beta hydrolase [Polymorphobacter megasporae]